MATDTITVYWAPGEDEQKFPFSKNMLYYPPVNLYKHFLPNKNPDLNPKDLNKDSSFFICPSVRDKMSRIFYMENSLETSVSIRDFKIIHETGRGIPLSDYRSNSINDTMHLRSDLTWFFFADEPIEVSFTAPYFHPVNYMSMMTLPPAQFDIGQWFRTFNAEYILWRKDADILIRERDPMFYMEFHTEKKIIFKRFEINEELIKLGAACSGAPTMIGRFKPLAERYTRFRKTAMRENVLRLINQNVIREEDV